jgi:hypothetical protein
VFRSVIDFAHQHGQFPRHLSLFEGAIMPVESIATPGSGHLKLTGSLGEVRPELVHPYYPGLKHHVFFYRLSMRARNSRLAGSRCTRMISGLRISVRWTAADTGCHDRCTFSPSCVCSEEGWAECRCRHGTHAFFPPSQVTQQEDW